MIRSGGEFGAVIFAQSRQAPTAAQEKRRKVTLSSGAFALTIVPQDLI
jgi:hypothetical protein